MASESLGIAVVGCGRMGRRRMETIVKHPRAHLVCVADVSAADSRSAGEEFDVPFLQDHAEVAGLSEVDCVIVSVPNRFHREAVTELLDSGKDVFCEKPLAGNPEDARAMLESAIANGKRLKTGSNLRYFPSVLKAKELLDSSAIGELIFARGWIGHEGWNLGGTWYADPEVIGGGTLLDNGAHLFDLLRWYLGEIVECAGMTATRLWDVEPLEDNAVAVMRTQSGALASIHSSWSEWRGYMYLEIFGSEGGIRIDNRQPASSTVFFRKERGTEEVFDSSDEPPTSYTDELDHYVRTMDTNEYPEPSGYDGLRAVQLAYAVYESASTKRVISTYSPDDEDLYLRSLMTGSR